MKAKSLTEIRELLASDAFQDWYRGYLQVRESVEDVGQKKHTAALEARQARLRSESVQQEADDLLFMESEYADRAAEALARFTEIENTSFQLLSDFEQQRLLASEAWSKQQALEKDLDDVRQRAAELRGDLDPSPAKRNPGEDMSRTRNQLQAAEEEITRLSHEVELATQRQSSEMERRDTMWERVETQWFESFTANMARAEYGYQARRCRGRAEEMFEGAEAERRRADEFAEQSHGILEREQELIQARMNVLEEGRLQFEAVLIEEFMYWADRDGVRSAYCVPLIEDSEHFNIQIRPLEIYHVERSRGLEFLEPVLEAGEVDAQEDPRLAAFFGGQ